MITALIVDDEAPARARMKKLLGGIAELRVLGDAANGLEALAKIESLSPDVIFLDIEMPGLDGFGVARTLGSGGPAIVFVTAYDEFALKAFDTYALDYLVKPVTENRLQLAIEKLKARRIEMPDLRELLGRLAEKQGMARLAVKTGNRYVVVDLERASAILARDHYSAILFDGRELLADETLDILEAKLDPAQFLRVHRSAIVNFSFIKELEREGDRKFTAVLSDPAKTKVPIARERMDEVRRRLGF